MKTGNLELLKSIVYMNGKLTKEMMNSFLTIRNMLVPEMAAIAAQNRSDEDIYELKNIINNHLLSFPEKDILVHSILAQATGNMVYIFILNFFNDIYRDHGDLYFKNEKNVKQSQKFHTEILRALEKKDSKGAKKITADVLKFTKHAINEYYISGGKE